MWHFGRLVGFGGLLAAFALYGATDALAQKKKNDKNSADHPAASDTDYRSIQTAKELTGTLVAIDTMNLTLRIEYPKQVPNPKYKPPKDNNPKSPNNQQYQLLKTYNDLQIQMKKAALAKNPKEALQAQQRIQQDLAKWQVQYNQFMQQAAKSGANQAKLDPNNQPFMIVNDTKDFDLEVMDKAVFRKLNLPFEYDDTGNIKAYTKEEKDALRGDDKTRPGYVAKFEELRAGQEVKLTLTPPKKKDAAPKEKDAPDMVQRPTVNMIVVTKDNAPPPTQDKKKKKN